MLLSRLNAFTYDAVWIRILDESCAFPNKVIKFEEVFA